MRIRKKFLFISLIGSFVIIMFATDLIYLQIEKFRESPLFHHTVWVILLINFGELIVLGIMFGILAKIFFEPLDTILKFVKKLLKNKETGKLPVMFPDEYGELCKSLNFLSDYIENYSRKYKRSLERERKLRSQIEMSSQMKSDFLKMLSKELKNPLNSVVGFSSLILNELKTGATPIELTHKIERIYMESQNLNNMISELIELAHFENLKNSDGFVNLKISEFSVVEFFNELLSSCNVLAEEKNIIIETYFLHTMPEIIRTDRDILLLAYTNLIANAIEVSPTNSRISMGCDFDGSHITFWVKDSYEGNESNPSVAEIYHRFLATDTEFIPHLGSMLLLNLAIADAKVQSLGGKIEVETDEGKTSLFKIIFDKHLLMSVPVSDTCSFYSASNWKNLYESHILKGGRGDPEVEKQTSEQTIIKNRTYKVLMAEEDEPNRELIALMLKNSEFDLDIVKDGNSCIRKLEECQYDIVILDLHLPTKSGMEILKDIRACALLQDLPVIILSAYLEEHEKEKLIQAGATECMLKPVEINELLSALRMLLRK